MRVYAQISTEKWMARIWVHKYHGDQSYLSFVADAITYKPKSKTKSTYDR
jgi:hypothetical protein